MILPNENARCVLVASAAEGNNTKRTVETVNTRIRRRLFKSDGSVARDPKRIADLVGKRKNERQFERD